MKSLQFSKVPAILYCYLLRLWELTRLPAERSDHRPSNETARTPRVEDYLGKHLLQLMMSSNLGQGGRGGTETGELISLNTCTGSSKLRRCIRRRAKQLMSPPRMGRVVELLLLQQVPQSYTKRATESLLTQHAQSRC